MRRCRTALAIALGAVLAVGLAACSGDGQPADRSLEMLLEETGHVKVTQTEARVLIEDQTSLVILDVRTAFEYGEGHLPNSYNLNYDPSAFGSALENLSRAATYLVYGSDGEDFRANAAAGDMVAAGVVRVYSLEGGLREWQGDVTVQ
ncbi:MAG: rhodanese-like domain-containing protein [Propionibacteriaceae bacterium]|jgi:rhodanese-related sulfurtransferase|nr:rhodanese-like domain-containing protein [Propionibacteriaceae bacterium]